MISVLTRGERFIRAVDQQEALDMFCPSDIDDAQEEEAKTREPSGGGQPSEACIDTPAQVSGNIRPKRQTIESIEKEVEEHSLTHCPYRNWCKICVEAQGKEDPHVSTHECSEGIPRFSMDYKEMSEYVEDQKKKMMTIIMIERQTTMSVAFVVKAKGSIEQAKRILEFIESFGYDKVSLKSDNEDVIKVLRDEAIHLRRAQTIPAGSVPYHPETHGIAEKAVQDVTTQLRKCKMALESRIKGRINVDAPIMEWMVEHAARILNCHLVGHDGRVPHNRAKSRNPFPTQVEFGEQVLAKHSRLDKKIARKGPSMSRAVAGTWVGMHDATGENIVIIEAGKAMRVRTIFRRPLSERWNYEVVSKITCNPLRPDPSREDSKISVLIEQVQDEDEGEEDHIDVEDSPSALPSGSHEGISDSKGDLPIHGDEVQCSEGIKRIPMRRRFKITKDILEQHGITEGCKGCQASTRGFERREHSQACRNRFAESMEKTEKGRLALECEKERLAEQNDEEVETDEIAESVANVMNNHCKLLCNAERLKEIFEKLYNENIEKGDYGKVNTPRSSQVDVAEVYSPPRVTAMAVKCGLKAGSALDLTTCDSDGKRLDFSFKEMRERARRKLNEENLECIVVCPMYGPFSQLQNVNYFKIDVNEVEAKLGSAVRHLIFAMEFCRWQASRGKLFVFEHLATATSWKLHVIREVMKIENTVLIDFDFCHYGMATEGDQGNALVKKRTTLMTNSTRIAQRIKRAQCSKDHEHAHLINFKAKACEIYPERFCKDICLGIKDEINDKQHRKGETDKELPAMITNAIEDEGKPPHDDTENYEWLYQRREFYNDITGEYLDKKRAIDARELEIDFFRKMKVYSKVPREVAKSMKAKVITTRWLDVSKGDRENPDYRSRLVGREIKRDQRLDLFAATPPLEALKMIVSICASNQSKDEPYRIMTSDIERAYFFAKARRPIFIEIPIEDREEGDEDMVGKFNLSLYGTRDAAQNWQAEFTDYLTASQFKKGQSSPCNFYHSAEQLHVIVHGDDFTTTGPLRGLKWFEQLLNKKYECKHKLLGPEGETNVRVLNRVLSWNKDGIYYEADHAELIIEQLKLEESKSVVILGNREDQTKTFEQDSDFMNLEEASTYRMMAARLIYLAMDRPDIQNAIKERAKQMPRPKEHHWVLIKRMGRYLTKVPRLVQKFDWLTKTIDITGYSDFDWAGDLLTRKSTSGGACMIASHTIKTWSSTQQIIALSTAEAELYALIKCACQCIGIISLAADFGVELKATVMTDASAALGISQRRGLGKFRHIDVQWLWIQERLHRGELKAQKIAGKENPADLMTKHLTADEMTKHVEVLGYEMRTDRSEKSLKISTVSNHGKDEWKQDAQCLIRWHNEARTKMFSLFQAAGCPSISQLTSTRITHGTYVDTGEAFMIQDNWTCRGTQWRDLRRPWTGRIVFIPKERLY